MPGEVRFAALVSATVVLLASLAVISVPVAAGAWSTQTTPTPPAGTANLLYDVSCEPSSINLCTAVGLNNTFAGNTNIPLALRWDGTSWSKQTPAKKSGATTSYLFGIDCPSTTRCIAIGNYEAEAPGYPATFAELWNEGKWSVQSTPVPAGTIRSELAAVGCNSFANCTAVGAVEDAEGTRKGHAVRWKSPTWTSESVPSPAGALWSELEGVDCIWSNFCVAVGEYTPISGEAQGYALFWNGSWSLQTLPEPGEAVLSRLRDVSCTPTPNVCTAVGTWTNTAGNELTLAYRFNGSSWTLQSTPNPAGSTASAFWDVSCATTTSCTAVGNSVSSGGEPFTLAEEWNGSSWSIQSTPSPPGVAFTSLLGVSCRVTKCLGVGFGTNTPYTLALIRE
jgi:hypothetical protein